VELPRDSWWHRKASAYPAGVLADPNNRGRGRPPCSCRALSYLTWPRRKERRCTPVKHSLLRQCEREGSPPEHQSVSRRRKAMRGRAARGYRSHMRVGVGAHPQAKRRGQCEGESTHRTAAHHSYLARLALVLAGVQRGRDELGEREQVSCERSHGGCHQAAWTKRRVGGGRRGVARGADACADA
jgi:hypothetical protein